MMGRPAAAPTRILAAVALALQALAGPAAAGHPWLPPLLTIDAGSLRRLAAEGRPVIAVDVRAPEAYRRGRLPGARSIPLSSLTRRRREVPADALVVLYGADGLDEAVTAYRYLRGAGHTNVFVLEGGFAGWQAQGHAVER
jgi:rhodanese-related sulfurtransferase